MRCSDVKNKFLTLNKMQEQFPSIGYLFRVGAVPPACTIFIRSVGTKAEIKLPLCSPGLEEFGGDSPPSITEARRAIASTISDRPFHSQLPFSASVCATTVSAITRRALNLASLGKIGASSMAGSICPAFVRFQNNRDLHLLTYEKRTSPQAARIFVKGYSFCPDQIPKA